MLLSQKKTLTGRPLLWALTVVYFASYMMRVNLAAVIQEIVTDTGFEKSTLSVILICLSVTYGLGQILNGFLADKIRPQNMIFFGNMISTIVNLTFPLFSHSVTSMAILWAINGFAQAMMWPPIMRILVENFEGEEYNFAQIFITWGTTIATVFIYLAAPLLITLSSWKTVFLVCGTVGIVGCVSWGLQKGRVPVSVPKRSAEQKASPKEKARIPAAAFLPIVLVAIAVACHGMLRDGVTAWMPSYLAEVFTLGNSTAIFCTVALALFSGVAVTIVGAIYKKWFKSEIFCAFLIFLVAALASLVLFFFFQSGGALLAILMMTLITGCMHGVNFMLLSHFPKRFKQYGNVATITGTINACSHVGAAIFTYGIAVLAEKIGWRFTVGVWILIAAVGLAVCLVAAKRWKKTMKE